MARLFFIFALLFPLLVFAQDQKTGDTSEEVKIVELGRVIQLNGLANRKGVDQENEDMLQLGSAVFSFDTISTEQDADVKIELLDGSTISLTSQSILQLTRYNFEENVHQISGLFSLIKGEVFSVMSSIFSGQEGNTFEIETVTAIAGVRGSAFAVSFDGKNTDVYSVEHDAFIQTRAGDLETISPSQRLRVGANNDRTRGDFKIETFKNKFSWKYLAWTRPANFRRNAPRILGRSHLGKIPQPWARQWRPGKLPSEKPKWMNQRAIRQNPMRPLPSIDQRRENFKQRQEMRRERVEKKDPTQQNHQNKTRKPARSRRRGR